MKGFKFITDIFNVFYKAERIKNDPDRQPVSVRFGITSIISTVFAVICAVGGSLLFKFALDNADELLILFIFALAFGVAFMAGSLIAAIGAILRAVAQMRINKKPIGVIALIISIFGLIASVIIVIAFLA